MKTKTISIVRGLSIITIFLGIIHEVATFTPLVQDGLECLSKSSSDAITYMSLMCGASLILSGWLLLLLLRKIGTHAFLASPILILSIFVFINGITSVVFMFDNPFAWIVFVLGLSITWGSSKLIRVLKK